MTYGYQGNCIQEPCVVVGPAHAIEEEWRRTNIYTTFVTMKTKNTTKLLRDGCSKETRFNDQLALKDFPAAAFSCSTHLPSLVSCATCPTISTRWQLQSEYSYIFVFPVDPPCCSRQKHLRPHLCHHCAATAQDEWSSLGWRPLSPWCEPPWAHRGCLAAQPQCSSSHWAGMSHHLPSPLILFFSYQD